MRRIPRHSGTLRHFFGQSSKRNLPPFYRYLYRTMTPSVHNTHQLLIVKLHKISGCMCGLTVKSDAAHHMPNIAQPCSQSVKLDYCHMSNHQAQEMLWRTSEEATGVTFTIWEVELAAYPSPLNFMLFIITCLVKHSRKYLAICWLHQSIYGLDAWQLLLVDPPALCMTWSALHDLKSGPPRPLKWPM